MPVLLNLDGEHPKCKVPNDTWRIFIDSDGRQNCEGYWDLSYASGPLDWKQLSKLKQLTELYYKGPDATVVDFIVSRGCQVTTFEWERCNRAKLDFSKAKGLEHLALYPERKTLQLKLPSQRSGFRTLRLVRPPQGFRASIACPDQGRALELLISGAPFLAIAGLKNLSELAMFACPNVDFAKVARAYPHLESLGMAGPSISLTNESALVKLKSLQGLRLDNCYSMDPEAFPLPEQMPALNSLSFDGLRSEDAEVLKAKYKSLDDLEIQGKRNAQWIANNLTNPFRKWEDDFSTSVGKKAMGAWKSANTAIDKLGQKAAKTKARKVLKEFVEVFNKLEQSTGLETDQRETIYEAYCELAAKLPAAAVSDDDYYGWAEYS